MDKTPTPQDTDLWISTVEYAGQEDPDSGGFWTMVHSTRAEAVAAVLEDVGCNVDGLDADERPTVEESHLQADDEGGPRSNWSIDQGYGAFVFYTVRPLRTDTSYGPSN